MCLLTALPLSSPTRGRRFQQQRGKCIILACYFQLCGEYVTPQNHIINLGRELFKSTVDSEASELLPPFTNFSSDSSLVKLEPLPRVYLLCWLNKMLKYLEIHWHLQVQLKIHGQMSSERSCAGCCYSRFSLLPGSCTFGLDMLSCLTFACRRETLTDQRAHNYLFLWSLNVNVWSERE